jgi:serine/threonine protein kinase
MHPRPAAALVVGVGKYENPKLSRLEFAAQDAKRIAEVLLDPALCGFPPDKVKVLTDEEASRRNLVHHLSKWLPGAARDAEIAVFFYAGHGEVHRRPSGEVEGFFHPCDADPDDIETHSVAMHDVARWLRGVQAGAIVSFLDCCHAGEALGFRDASGLRERGVGIVPDPVRSLAGKARYLFASCGEGQRSLESAERQSGLFTYHLVEGIRGEADRDGDGKVSLSELFEHVSTTVLEESKRHGHEQQPWSEFAGSGPVYLSTLERPADRGDSGDSDADRDIDRILIDQGEEAAIAEVARRLVLPEVNERRRIDLLGRLRRMARPSAVLPMLRCLLDESKDVRDAAKACWQAIGKRGVADEMVAWARAARLDAVGVALDALDRLEARPDFVGILGRIAPYLKGELRNRLVLLEEKKRLKLDEERDKELFNGKAGPYRIEKALGQGLIAASYLGNRDVWDKKLVVRILRPEFASRIECVRCFLDLGRKALDYVHPNLVVTRDVGFFDEERIFYTVIDYMGEVTLQKLLSSGKTFDQLQVIRIVEQLLHALEGVHPRGCHGGIKPSNVFVCEGDRIVLGDPGIRLGSLQVLFSRLSYDYRYTAPERIGAASAEDDPRSDFYSLGCLTYELACGKAAFSHDDPIELALLQKREPPRPPGEHNGELSGTGETFIIKLLEKDPERRFSSVREAFDDLEEWKESVVARAPAAIPPQMAGAATRYVFERGISAADLLRSRPIILAPKVPPPSKTAEPAAGYEDQTDYPGGPHGAHSRPEAASLLNDPLLRDVPVVDGYKVLEPCILLHKVGSGGFGAVYRARHGKLEIDVAVKFLGTRDPDAQPMVGRFQREARLLARVNHPNLVRVFDLGQRYGLHYIVMEFVEGETARELVQRRGSLVFAEALRILLGAARGLAAAHAMGIVHRDFKPDNLLLSRSGEVKVADLGLGGVLAQRVASTASESNLVVGTPRYMPPEQWKGLHEVGPPGDVWALGATTYFLLVGEDAITGDSTPEIMRRVCQEPFPDVASRCPRLPGVLGDILRRCTSTDPASRYPTADDLLEDLEVYLEVSHRLPNDGEDPTASYTKVRVRFPRGTGLSPETLSVPQSENLFDAFLHHGLATKKRREEVNGRCQNLWRCGEHRGECGYCIVRVLQGGASLSEPSRKEKRQISRQVKSLNDAKGWNLNPAECRFTCLADVTGEGPIEIELFGDIDAT